MLEELIKNSPSMDEEEKKYWIELLPSMNEIQLNKFQTILENEQLQNEIIDEQFNF